MSTFAFFGCSKLKVTLLKTKRDVAGLTKLLETLYCQGLESNANYPKIARLEKQAVQALGEIGSPQAIVALTELLGFRGEWQQTCIYPPSISSIHRSTDTEQVKLEGTFRLGIADVLKGIGTPAIEALIRIAKDKDSESLRREWAMYVLATTGKRTATEALIQVLDNSEYRGRTPHGVALCLGFTRDPIAIGPLIRAVTEERVWVGDAVKALKMIGGEPALDALIQLLENPRYQETAAEALGEIGDQRAVGPLVQALNKALGHGRTIERCDYADAYYDVHVPHGTIATALAAIGGEAAVSGLAQALAHEENKDGRRTIAQSLGHIGGEAARTALATALEHETDPDTRSSIEWALKAAETRNSAH